MRNYIKQGSATSHARWVKIRSRNKRPYLQGNRKLTQLIPTQHSSQQPKNYNGMKKNSKTRRRTVKQEEEQ